MESHFALLGSPVFRKAATLAVVRASRCRLTLCTARYGGRKGNSGSKQAAAIWTHSQAISSTLEFRFILFFYFFSSWDVQKVESSVFGVVFLAIICVGGVGFFCASCCWVGVFCLVGCRCLFGGLCFGGRFLVFFLLSFPERVTVIFPPRGLRARLDFQGSGLEGGCPPSHTLLQAYRLVFFPITRKHRGRNELPPLNLIYSYK